MFVITMRFFCCSDTHGLSPPDVADSGITAWLHAGDFFDKKLSAAQEEIFFDWRERRFAPVFSVPGNHDCVHALDFLNRYTKQVSGKVARLADGLYVAGIGWSGSRYFDLPDETELNKVCQAVLAEASSLSALDRCILLSHYPPRIPQMPFGGQSDSGFVFDCVRAVVDALKPLAVIQGHVHDFFYQTAAYQTGGKEVLVVNPGPDGGVLTVEPQSGAVSYQHWIS